MVQVIITLLVTLVGASGAAPAKVSHTHESGSDDRRNVPVTNSIGMKLILVLAGEFMMGNAHSTKEDVEFFRNKDCPLCETDMADEYPQHRVRIRKEFYLGIYPVTRGQFRRFVEEAKYRTEAEKEDSSLGIGAMGWTSKEGDKFEWHKDWSWRSPGFPQTDDHPVVDVTYDDAVAFCKWLSRKEGKVYRLPSEAEWEYACRAGTTTRYSFGDDPKRLAEFANVADATARKAMPGWKFTISASDGYVFTSPVGRFRPNAFGLYDMHGNVAQWCADSYKQYDSTGTSEADPASQESDDDDLRSVRGGTWCSGAWACRSSCRLCEGYDNRFGWLGFRVICEKCCPAPGTPDNRSDGGAKK